MMCKTQVFLAALVSKTWGLLFVVMLAGKQQYSNQSPGGESEKKEL